MSCVFASAKFSLKFIPYGRVCLHSGSGTCVYDLGAPRSQARPSAMVIQYHFGLPPIDLVFGLGETPGLALAVSASLTCFWLAVSMLMVMGVGLPHSFPVVPRRPLRRAADG